MNNLKITLAAAGLALASLLAFTTCKMEVSETIRAFVGPYISVHPASAVYTPGAYPTADPPALETDTWDWDGIDGELSYQWFSFASIAEYLENDYEGTEIPDATEKTYTPSFTSTDTVPGKTHYFYVEVTNTKEGNTATVRSEVATISFAAATEGEYPVITRHPASATYIFGTSMATLGFKTKKLSTAGTLSYQWYKGELDTEGKIKIESGKPKGTELSKLDYLLLLPRTDEYTMNIKDNFFWVEIKFTPSGAGDAVTVVSIPAKITLNPAARAQPPRILKQPGDRLYLTGQSTLDEIKFDAESTDFGDLSFQWYSNDNNSTAGGTPIETNGTSKTYTPTVSTSAVGTFYYYVEVTNTNENVTGTKTATITSKIAQVSVRAASTKSATALITISNPTLAANRFNYVRGYGGMSVAWANFPEEKAADTQKMYGDGPDELGYNILRIMIPPANTNIEISMNDLTQSQRKDYYESVKIVNKYGGYVLASPWSPPKEWKSNNSINGGGYLMPRYYRQFANYLKAFAQHMYDKGAPIYAVSIANEPNYVAGYDGCEWTGAEMRDFFIEVGHFTNGVRGFGGGVDMPTVLTMNGESANTPNINFAALDDPVSRSVIDLYARHVYGRQTETLWENQYATWEDGHEFETECWMTEHNINSANNNAYKFDSTWPYVWRFMNDVDLVMRINKENGFVWWASKRFYSMIGDNSNATNDGAPLPRGWGLSHYAKYTIDTRRIAIDISGTNKDNNTISQGGSPDKGVKTGVVNSDNFHLDNLSAKITAYVSRDGNEITMVMWTPTNTDETEGTDMGLIEITMPTGFEIGNASAVRSTSATSIMVPELLEVNSTRTKAYVDLPPANIVSVRFTRK